MPTFSMARTGGEDLPSSTSASNRSIRVAVFEHQVIANIIQGLGFDVTYVTRDKIPELATFDVVYLPTAWAQTVEQVDRYDKLDNQFHAFMRAGGGLVVGQPNPHQVPGRRYVPKLLPYPIEFLSTYDKKNRACECLVKDHFITQGLSDKEMPYPADEMRQIDKRYTILARQKSPKFSSLLVSEFGKGRVVVHASAESRNAAVKLSDDVLRRMIVWAAHRDGE